MKDEQLNRLAVLTAAGCVESRDSLLRYFIPIVERLSREVWHLLRDDSSFEHECYRKLERAAAKWRSEGEGSGRSFRIYALHKIKGIRSTHLKRRSIQRNKLTSIEALAGGEDGEVTYEVIDDLAVVDDGILVNEKIVLLAEDDSRKLAILKSWTNGYTDSQAALSLAGQCGGNAESHRKFITRFRTTCRKALA